MTEKFTPSPWGYDGKFTVSIPHAKGDTYFRTNPEDARLIYAAPDLYEALKSLRDAVHAGGFPHDPVKQADAALAKASP